MECDKCNRCSCTCLLCSVGMSCTRALTVTFFSTFGCFKNGAKKVVSMNMIVNAPMFAIDTAFVWYLAINSMMSGFVLVVVVR